MKKIILTILTGVVLFVASLSAAVAVNNKIKNTKYDLIVNNSAGGSIVIDIDGEQSDVPSGSQKTLIIKRKTKVTLSATADEKHNFAGWQLGSTIKNDSEITLTITSKTEVKSKYESKTVNVTVDGETMSYGIANNLLAFLQQAFPADPGYTKTYYIGAEQVTSNTEICEATTITSQQELITYYVTFMHNDQQLGEKLAYNVENKNVIAPTLPQEEGFSVAWPEFNNRMNDLVNFSVYSIKTPIEYTATFKYEDETIEEIKFNITNKDNLVAPALPQVEAGYEAKWENFTLGLEDATINLIVTPIEYTVSFKHNGTLIDTRTYTVENKNITKPTVPTQAGYTISWEEYELTTGNITVNTIVEIDEYTVTFKHNGEVVKTATYTVENKNITKPAKPASSDKYDYSWGTVDLTDKLEDIVVESIATAKTFNIAYTEKTNDETGLTVDEIEALNNATTYTCETTTFTLTNPSREGYEFLGWTENNKTDKELTVTINKGSFGNKTYTAHWEKKVATIKLGELTNVSAIYYGTSKDNINTLLTEAGFKADSSVTYFFKAIVKESTETQYYVLELIGITDSEDYYDLYNAETGFKFDDHNNSYTISAIAYPVDFSAIEFEVSGLSSTAAFDLWLNTATREGDNLNYYYLNSDFEETSAEISISDYLEDIYSVTISGTTTTITQVRFTYADNTFYNKGVSSANVLINLFMEYTNQKVTVTFTYSA